MLDTRIQAEFNIAKTAGSPLGVKHSREVRDKRSEILKRYWTGRRRILSAETRKKISLAQMGTTRIFTQQHRDALSAAATGRSLSLDVKVKIGAANRGKERQFTDAHKINSKAAWAARKGKHGTVSKD